MVVLEVVHELGAEAARELAACPLTIVALSRREKKRFARSARKRRKK